jgi:hypothetical protein
VDVGPPVRGRQFTDTDGTLGEWFARQLAAALAAHRG